MAKARGFLAATLGDTMPRRKPRRPWIDYLVYLAVRLVVAFAQMLTIAQSYALARFLARVTYKVDARHRMVGIENLRLAYGDRYDDPQRDRIVRSVYLHFCMMIMELLHIPRKIHVTNWRQYARLVGHPPILDRFMTGGPMILLTGHYGNWELAGYLFGLFGYPTYSVARTLDNPYLDRFLRIPGADRPEADPQVGGLRPDPRGAPVRPGTVDAGRPGRRATGDVRGVLRPACLDAQGHRAAGHRAPRTRGRRRRATHRPRLSVRDPLRRGHPTRRIHRLRRRRAAAHPALHLGPGRTDPPGPDAVSLAASAVETPATTAEGRVASC